MTKRQLLTLASIIAQSKAHEPKKPNPWKSDVEKMKTEAARKTSTRKGTIVVSTTRPIGYRIADIGPGQKEYNVKTDAAWDAHPRNRRPVKESVYKVTNLPKGAKTSIGVTSFGMTAAEKAAKATKDAAERAQDAYGADVEDQRGPKHTDWYKDLGKGLPTGHLKKARETNPHPFVNEATYRAPADDSPAKKPKKAVKPPTYDELYASRKAATLAFAKKHHIIDSVNYRIHGTAQTYDPKTQSWDVKDHKSTVSARNSKAALKSALKHLQQKYPHHHEHEVKLDESSGLHLGLAMNEQGQYIAKASRPNVKLSRLRSAQRSGTIRPNVKLRQLSGSK